MRNRIKIWLLNRRLWRSHQFKARYMCTGAGCDRQVSTLRFLFIGCECGMHSWYRRRGF